MVISIAVNCITNFKTSYTLSNASNGNYVFVLGGSLTIGNIKLKKRDGMRVWDIPEISVKANSNSEVLLIEVPLHV